jgi:hypothetical protein
MGPRAGLDAGARRKILCPCRGSNPDRPARSQTLYWLSYRWQVYLIPQTRVLIEKLIATQLVKKIQAFYGTSRFITEFTKARHSSLSWARWIHYTSSQPISFKNHLILFSNLRQVFQVVFSLRVFTHFPSFHVNFTHLTANLPWFNHTNSYLANGKLWSSS